MLEKQLLYFEQHDTVKALYFCCITMMEIDKCTSNRSRRNPLLPLGSLQAKRYFLGVLAILDETKARPTGGPAFVISSVILDVVSPFFLTEKGKGKALVVRRLKILSLRAKEGKIFDGREEHCDFPSLPAKLQILFSTNDRKTSSIHYIQA